MNKYLLYAVAFVVGIVFPFGPRRWALAFIVSVAFDELRVEELALSNAFLMASLGSFSVSKYIRQVWKNVPMFVPMALLAVLAVIATVLAEDRRLALSNFVSLSSLIGICLVIPSVTQRVGDLGAFMRAVLWMSGLTAVAVLVEGSLYLFLGIQVKNNIYALMNLERDVLQSTGFFSSNALAAFHILPGAALALCLRAAKSDFMSPRKLVPYLILVSLAVIVTLSRAAIISLLFSLVLVFSEKFRTGQGTRAIAFIGLVGLLAVAPTALGFLAGFNRGSFLARYCILYGAVKAIRQNPVLGNGLGSRVYADFPPTNWGNEAFWEGVSLDPEGRDTHNTFVQVAVDLGLLGLGCLLAMNIMLLKKWHRAGRFISDMKPRIQIKAVLIALVVTEFSAVFNSTLYLKPLWILFGIAGAGVALAEMQRKARIGSPGLVPNDKRVPLGFPMTAGEIIRSKRIDGTL